MYLFRGKILWGWLRSRFEIIEIRFLVSSMHEYFVHTSHTEKTIAEIYKYFELDTENNYTKPSK